MSKKTKIQWCHSTVNPVMGCGGCELFPRPSEILGRIDTALTSVSGWKVGASRSLFSDLITEAFSKIKTPLPGHLKGVSTLNLQRSHILNGTPTGGRSFTRLRCLTEKGRSWKGGGQKEFEAEREKLHSKIGELTEKKSSEIEFEEAV